MANAYQICPTWSNNMTQGNQCPSQHMFHELKKTLVPIPLTCTVCVAEGHP
jgi:hypothetical protein